jgi:hypothetical protein
MDNLFNRGLQVGREVEAGTTILPCDEGCVTTQLLEVPEACRSCGIRSSEGVPLRIKAGADKPATNGATHFLPARSCKSAT